MNQFIARLDHSLAQHGEWIILRRIVGTTNAVNIDVKCRATVNDYAPEELVGGIMQTDSKVIMSPTQITDAQWPGGAAPLLPPFNVDPRVPRINDKVIAGGRIRNISFVNPITVGDELVRIELRIAG